MEDKDTNIARTLSYSMLLTAVIGGMTLIMLAWTITATVRRAEVIRDLKQTLQIMREVDLAIRPSDVMVELKDTQRRIDMLRAELHAQHLVGEYIPSPTEEAIDNGTAEDTRDQ